MGKAKWAELEQARRDGMGYALKIAREKGIKGLEDEIRFRNISRVSVAMSDEEYKELINAITANSITGFTTLQEQLEIL